jgi:AhpC/TSA family protein
MERKSKITIAECKFLLFLKGDNEMNCSTRYQRGLLFVGLLLASWLVLAGGAWAVETGDKAPDFKLPATTGLDISLSDYRGKKWVLIEFYGGDFQPT